MRGLSLLGASLLLLACSPARRAWRPEVPPPGTATPAAYALVSLATPLAIAPRADAPAARVIAPDRDGADPSAAPYGVFQVVGQERAWVALETLGRAPALHCGEPVRALEPFRLRLFVPASALSPITQREVQQRFPDGTSIELARGVPLVPIGRGRRFRARLGTMSAIVDLGLADVGTRYLPSAQAPRPAPVRLLRADAIAAGVPVLGGASGRIGASADEDLPIYAEDARGAESFVELRGRCARVIVRVPAHVLEEPVDRSASGASAIEPPSSSGAPEDGTRARIRAGARVLWRDGRVAGVVTREVLLDRETDASGALRCFLHAIGEDGAGDASGELELCFDRRAVVTPGAGPASSLDPPR